MRNIDRIAKHLTENGTDGVLIHTIPGTRNWLIGQKIENNKWLLTLGDPMGNVFYNIGTTSNTQYVELWTELTKVTIEGKTTQTLIARQLKQTIRKFIKTNNYQKFIKILK
jgi:hypothetical protein